MTIKSIPADICHCILIYCQLWLFLFPSTMSNYDTVSIIYHGFHYHHSHVSTKNTILDVSLIHPDHSSLVILNRNILQIPHHPKDIMTIFFLLNLQHTVHFSSYPLSLSLLPALFVNVCFVFILQFQSFIDVLDDYIILF